MPPKPPGPTAALYTRISRDDDGERLGVQRQEEDLRREAKRRGATVRAVFEDNDLSGSGKVQRPAFDQLIRAIESGDVDLVLAWDLDRLSRGMKPFVRLYEACEKAGIVVAWLGGQANFATGEGLLELEIRASFAREELRKIRKRIQRKHQQLADTGKSAGGGRPFGYERDRRTLREPATMATLSDRSEVIVDEPALIREAARRVFEGESMRSICRDLNARCIPTVGGSPAWSAQVLRRLLVSARISGRREYSYAAGRRLDVGRITCDEAEWPAIVSVEVSDRLRQLLGGPGHRRKGRSREYLLTGLARCGRCGSPLQAHPRSDGRREMACVKRPGSNGCGRLGILAPPVDALVSETVVRAAESGAFARALERGDDSEARAATQQLLDVKARQDELADMWTQGTINRDEWTRARAGLQDREDALRRLIERQRRPRALDGVPADLRQAWAGLPLHRRRAFV